MGLAALETPAGNDVSQTNGNASAKKKKKDKKRKLEDQENGDHDLNGTNVGDSTLNETLENGDGESKKKKKKKKNKAEE